MYNLYHQVGEQAYNPSSYVREIANTLYKKFIEADLFQTCAGHAVWINKAYDSYLDYPGSDPSDPNSICTGNWALRDTIRPMTY